MLTTQPPHLKVIDGATSSVDFRLDRWLKIWTAMLAVNGACCIIVWITSLGADPVRQLLAGALAALSAVLAWKKDPESSHFSEGLPTHKPTRGAIIALVAACLIIMVTGCVHTARVYLIANIALLVSFVWAFFGWQRCKIIAPAVFLALFTLPDLPEEFRAYLFIPLQHICTVTAGEVAKLFVPITYSGHVFTVDGQQLNLSLIHI